MPAHVRKRSGAPILRQSDGPRGNRGSRMGSSSNGGVSYAGLVEIQRARLLAAAVGAMDELGYANTTVADITSRARVSRRTFYELFSDREDCLAAVLEDSLQLIRAELEQADFEGLDWCEQMRAGLWAILTFFDREPALARVCVVQASRGEPKMLARREQVFAELAAKVDKGREESTRGGECTPLTAEGLVGATYAIVHARLLRGECPPLTSLVGELTGMIALPYLGAAAARREQTRPTSAGSTSTSREQRAAPGKMVSDPLEGVPMRLTYRTARVLKGVAEMAERGSPPSNRMIADHAGIADAGQVSKLLARLERLGLLANANGGHSKGEPNAWNLTAKGERVAQSIYAHEPRAQATA